VVGVLTLALLSLSPGHADDPAPGALVTSPHESDAAIPLADRVVLLRDGQLYEGSVEHSVDGFRIRTARGATMTFDSRQVAFVGPSRWAAYDHRRAILGPRDLAQHAELAAWCLRHRIVDGAIDQIELLRAAQFDAVRLAALDEQLAARMTDGDQLAPDLRLMFESRIAPRLLSSCTLGGCHSRVDDSFRLVSGTTANASYSSYNWFAVRSQLNVDEPTASPLLVAARTAHGDLVEPVFEADSADYAALTRWVTRAAESLSAAPSATAAPNDNSPSPTVDQTVPLVESIRLPSSIAPPAAAPADVPTGDDSDLVEPVLVEPVVPESEAESVSDLPEDAASAENAEPAESASSSNPYDPAPFNRRHFDK